MRVNEIQHKEQRTNSRSIGVASCDMAFHAAGTPTVFIIRRIVFVTRAKLKIIPCVYVDMNMLFRQIRHGETHERVRFDNAISLQQQRA